MIIGYSVLLLFLANAGTAVAQNAEVWDTPFSTEFSFLPIHHPPAPTGPYFEHPVCNDPVETLCEGKRENFFLSKIAKDTLARAVKKLPTPLQEPGLASQLAAEFYLLEQQYWSLRSSGQESEALQIYRRLDQVRHDFNQYHIQLNRVLMSEIHRRKISLQRDLLVPVQKSLIRHIQLSQTLQRSLLKPPTPTPFPGLNLDFRAATDNTSYKIKVLPNVIRESEEYQLRMASTIGPDEFARSLQKATLTNIEIQKEPQVLTPDEIFNNFVSCGDADINAKMYTTHNRALLTLCPGTLALILATGDTTTTQILIAHEMGHMIDSDESYVTLEAKIESGFSIPLLKYRTAPDGFASNSEIERLLDRSRLNKRYEPYLSCVKKHYLHEIQFSTQIPHYAKNYILPEIEKSKAEALSNPDLSPQERFKLQTAFNQSLDYYKVIAKACEGNSISKLNRIFGSGTGNYIYQAYCVQKTPYNGFDRELISDAYSQRHFIQLLITTPPEKKLKVAKQALGSFCANRSGSDLTHPPAGTRIEMIFQHPEVRRAFGCKTQARRPFCAIR